MFRPPRVVMIVAVLCYCGASTFAQDALDPTALSSQLGSQDAVAEAQARQQLPAMGERAVAALAARTAPGQVFAGRMIAVELLGQIGTPAARDRLLELLKDEKNLAVRGQIIMQLGYLREDRAVPLIADWLGTIGPRALDDVPGGKEFQPSTCYLRHLEALGMIGDESTIPVIEQFRRKIPPGIGYGGFISNFVDSGAREAVEEVKQKSAFRKAVSRQPGLDRETAAMFAFCRRDPLARLRLYEDKVIRHTPEGKATLATLAGHSDPAVAQGARALLEKWDELGKPHE